MKRKLAIAYIRVSTDGQDKDDTYGKELQRQSILDYADRNGYIIDRWYEEVGSGAKERPILENICFGDEVDNPPIEALLVFKNDRIARDTKLYFYYLYLLEKKGIKLLSVQEDFGEDSQFANLYRSMLQFVAEQERKNIQIRTSLGKDAKAQNGGYCGGRVPYGYKIVNKELEVDEDEAIVVRDIFKYLDAGMGLRSVAKVLGDKGYIARNGSPFTFNTVRSIRNNRKTYEGMYKFGNNDWVKGKHEAIL